MGREVKRIHIDFDLFEREGQTTWEGYLLDEITCPLCDGDKKTLTKKECPVCYGTGKISPTVEPPKGWGDKESGYQVWQDVSEGGPVSPVFLKPEKLARWMVKNDDSITRDTSYEVWLKFINEEGSAPSMILNNKKGLKSGVSGIYDDED